MTRLFSLSLGIAVTLSSWAVPGGATTLSFTTGIAPLGGSIVVAGSNVMGSNIPYQSLSVSGAPANNGLFALSGTAAGSSAAFNFSTITDMFSLVGTIPTLGITSSTTLVSGVITSFMIGTATSLSVNVTFSGTGSVNNAVFADLGLAGTNNHFTFSGFELGASTNGSPYTATSSSFAFLQAPSTVPEPASVFLFGGGMLALTWLARKVFLKSADSPQLRNSL